MSKRRSAIRMIRTVTLYLLYRIVSGQDESSEIRPVILDLPGLGQVQGSRRSGTDFFGGLPYAAPPVGSLRFAPPESVAPWEPSRLDATQYPPDCWQVADPLMNPGVKEEDMSEDCLYLNVFTPAGLAKTRQSLPVMVWLHGGAFQQGSSARPEYDGHRLAERGAVVVTINYRLGALGFLVSSADGLYGNFGLMDQRAALHWIRDNISHFGGDPDNVTLFGESAGAVMAALHLMMDGAGSLFHRVILQSNPLGLQFRSVVVADFIGEALKRSIDCRDLDCLRAERVEEIIRAQKNLMGVPRSVGDFFTWGPTLTSDLKLTVGPPTKGISPLSREHIMFRDLESWKWQSERDNAWTTVNVTQPLKTLELIPDDIPVIIGSNKNEGEMFVHGAFPITMSKAVYWMFVGALFRDSASRVLKHYRGYVDQIEGEAQRLAQLQVEEEENRQFYFEHREKLDHEYELLLEMNESKSEFMHSDLEKLVSAWGRGGFLPQLDKKLKGLWQGNDTQVDGIDRKRLRQERRARRVKDRALQEAAKVVVDYRPVMSRIIDDYLFRCPAWHFAHFLSRQRKERNVTDNVFVYQFSHSTHIPGFRECWGKACHTSEVPYAFQSMDIIRSNYSTLGPFAQDEAPSSPEYPFTELLRAYRGAIEAADRAYDGTASDSKTEEDENGRGTTNHRSIQFQKILNHFFGDYFKEDADEEIANDMANRWVAFSYSGDPNYEESTTRWMPWRYNDINGDTSAEDFAWEVHNLDQIFEVEVNENDINASSSGSPWSQDPQDLAFRRHVLHDLGLEVAEEDVFQTFLRRIKEEPAQVERGIRQLLFGGPGSGNKRLEHDRRPLQYLQRVAQDMGILGVGLRERYRITAIHEGVDTTGFFPEILDLKWPPENRLIERDCTCDLWEQIKYKY